MKETKEEKETCCGLLMDDDAWRSHSHSHALTICDLRRHGTRGIRCVLNQLKFRACGFREWWMSVGGFCDCDSRFSWTIKARVLLKQNE